ncbi:hypothetical protein, partial [Streptococcus pantholopis]
RVQLNKIQRPLKTQKENRGWQVMSCITLTAIFFPQRLGRVQLTRYKAREKIRMKIGDGK